jgi:hypothetical protein
MCVQCEITVFLQAVSCSILRNTQPRGRQNLIILYLVLPEYTLSGPLQGMYMVSNVVYNEQYHA